MFDVVYETIRAECRCGLAQEPSNISPEVVVYQWPTDNLISREFLENV